MHPRHAAILALRVTPTAALICLAGWSHAATSTCGPLDNPYGPFDYVTQKNRLGVVEQYHFTPSVEALTGGSSSYQVGEDIDYTLRAFPNHHRALMALVRLGERKHSAQPVGLTYSVECYFERALRFRPLDGTVRMIYARYLFQDQRLSQANQQLEAAASTAGDNAFAHYNIGLLYLEQENYALALAHAHKAYSLGFLQPALREQLQLRGKWKEPQRRTEEDTQK
jgi:tetratricopeptide (TPR) repeat protein